MIILIGNHLWQRIKAPSTPLTSFPWYGVFYVDRRNRGVCVSAVIMLNMGNQDTGREVGFY